MGCCEISEQLDLKNCFVVFVIQITCLRRGGGVVRLHPGGGSGSDFLMLALIDARKQLSDRHP